MIKLEIYDNTKTYFYPNMTTATPEEVSAQYAIVNVPNLKTVIQTDKAGIMFYTSPEPIHILADRYGVDMKSYETDKEVLLAIEEILNAPQPEPEPSAEERIAAAMEYQNLLSM